MYIIIYKLHQNGTYNSPWLMCIKKILCDSGNPNFWSDQDLLSPQNYMKNDILLNLRDQFLQEWQVEVFRNRKCVAYRIIKDDITSESYLSNLSNLDFVDRRALCKFRTGNHRLPVAKSRIGGGGKVTCRLCQTEDICDEFHVLFICKFFDEYRKKYLKRNQIISLAH